MVNENLIVTDSHFIKETKAEELCYMNSVQGLKPRRFAIGRIDIWKQFAFLTPIDHYENSAYEPNLPIKLARADML